MHETIDALVEIFSWVGLGAGALLAVTALVMRLFDGTWLPTRAVVETVALVNERWWKLPERDVVPAPVIERIDAHVTAMTPILNSCAEK